MKNKTLHLDLARLQNYQLGTCCSCHPVAMALAAQYEHWHAFCAEKIVPRTLCPQRNTSPTKRNQPLVLGMRSRFVQSYLTVTACSTILHASTCRLLCKDSRASLKNQSLSLVVGISHIRLSANLQEQLRSACPTMSPAQYNFQISYFVQASM